MWAFLSFFFNRPTYDLKDVLLSVKETKDRERARQDNLTFSCIFFFNPQTINCLWKKKARDVSYVPVVQARSSAVLLGGKHLPFPHLIAEALE